MATARQLHVWQPAAEVLAMIANVNLEKFRRKSAFPARQFLPDVLKRELGSAPPKNGGDLTLTDMEEFLDP